MRQKVNPHELRCGVIKDWDSLVHTEGCKENLNTSKGLKIGIVKDWDSHISITTKPKKQ